MAIVPTPCRNKSQEKKSVGSKKKCDQKLDRKIVSLPSKKKGYNHEIKRNYDLE